MHTVPCGHLIEGQIPSCDTGRAVPEDCGACPAYLAGLTVQERTRCEIWSRVMGYHRPVSAFNPCLPDRQAGKRSEHEERRYFVDRPGDLTQGPACLPTCLPAYRTGRPHRQAAQAGRTGRGSTC